VSELTAVSGPRDPGARTALAELATLLVSGETVVASALQHRLFALIHRRTLAAATTGRLIVLRRRLLRGYDPVGIRWQDLREVNLAVGMIAAKVTVAYSANLSDTAMDESDTRLLTIGGLRPESAQALYRECQAQEQAWREKRRVRSIEEMRAKAGGVQIATGVYPPGSDTRPADLPLAGASAETPAEKLGRAKDLQAQGLITDAEYEAIKARIVQTF
jgi:hypothetical protein